MDGIEDGEVQGTEGAPGPNPAWNDVLGVIPEQYHSQVTPYFQQWDQSAQQRVEQANAQVKQFEPYKEFADHGIDPSELQQGLRLMYEINQNPRSVYDALAQAYNLGGVGNGEVEDDDDDDRSQQQFQDPRFDQLQEGIELVSRIVLEDQNSKLAQQAEQELDNELNELRKKHGDFNEQFVLAMMDVDMSGDEAVAAYKEFVNNLLQNNPRPFAPNILGNSGGGSGLPSQAIDPTKMQPKDVRNLVAEMARLGTQD